MAPLTAPALPVRTTPTEADRLAASNSAANVAALARSQPQFTAPDLPADLTWAFGRDGALTAFEPGERWLNGCSVPLAAARAVLKTLEAGGGPACFLDPRHAADVRAALERLEPTQALVCVVPEPAMLAVMLHCDDFATELSAGRLWFAGGPNWADELAWLFVEAPGLPSPSRFVRLPNADAALVEQLVTGAQRVFASLSAARSAKVAATRDGWASSRPRGGRAAQRVCVIARSRFRLWDDAGDTLYAALTSAPSGDTIEWSRFDPDAPAGSSPLALALACAAADVIVTADLGRADAAHLAHRDQPWITWLTGPRIPSALAAGPNDRLIAADPAWREEAIRAGWDPARVDLAGWPRAANTPGGGDGLAIIADTMPLDAPDSLAEFSSHCLLWDKLRRVVLHDPFELPDDVGGWVRDQARAHGIAVDTLDVPLFLNRLIVPAYQQALADALLAAGLPLRLFGSGWAEFPRFRAHAAAEPVDSRAALAAAATRAAALVHAWPGHPAAAHAIDALGRPVVRRTGRRMEGFVRAARLALAGTPEAGRVAEVAPISPAVVLSRVSLSRAA